MSEQLFAIEQLQQQLSSSQAQLQTVVYPAAIKQDISWQMLRLDQIDEQLSGNKLFKLLPFLKLAAERQTKTLISFGGRYSNHLHALAYACQRFGFKLHAVVRGYPEQALTPMLQDIKSLGAGVQFAGHQEYRLRYDADYQRQLLSKFDQAMVINEGGNSLLGHQGMRLMAKVIENSITQTIDYMFIPTGTGCCFAGLLDYLPKEKFRCLLAVPALQNSQEIDAISQAFSRPSIVLDGYHFGGFAKINDQLRSFSQAFEQQHSIPLDPVYTVKMSFAIDQMIKNKVFAAGSRIVSLHTGGLQGARDSYDVHAAGKAQQAVTE